MQIETIRDLATFEALAEEWNHLLTRCASHVPFLRHEFLTTWWRSRGGGEWDGGELMILTARESGGGLAGAAPLFLHQESGGDETLRFMGTKEIADYLDFIAAPDDLSPFLAALVKYLVKDDSLDWQGLDLHNLLQDSPTIAVLETLARE